MYQISSERSTLESFISKPRIEKKCAFPRISSLILFVVLCQDVVRANRASYRRYNRAYSPLQPLNPTSANNKLDFHLSSTFASEWSVGSETGSGMKKEQWTRYGHSLESSPVLVLNANYQVLSHEPLSLWSWQDAIRAVWGDKATVVSEYPDILIRSVSTSFFLPSVIALKTYQRKSEKVPMLSRKYVLIRDGYTCQYCSNRYGAERLSLDHIWPRSKGGKLTWENTVCACLECNSRKGSTPPDEIERNLGMRLKKKPHEPTFAELQYKAKKYKNRESHPHWNDYL
jgi:5-methylcytosine-specific restriction endonuclease McrA